MPLYVSIIGIALGLAVVMMFVTMVFSGRRTRNVVNQLRRPTSKPGRYRDRSVWPR